jgi:hypothetical protein
MTFDPALVERHTCVVSPDGTVRTKASRGFGELPPLDIPIGCPPEFAAMIRAAANGDTSLIERSYWEHPERRQRPELQETRSTVAAVADEEDDDDDDEDEIERIDGLYLEAGTRELKGLTVTDQDTANKASRLQHRIADLTRSRPEPTHLEKRIAARASGEKRKLKFKEPTSAIPSWALEITRKAEERGRKEIAYRRLVLLNTITDIGVADEIF